MRRTTAEANNFLFWKGGGEGVRDGFATSKVLDKV